MTKTRIKAEAIAAKTLNKAREQKIFDFMLGQAQARVLAATAERRAILAFRERYFRKADE